MSHVLVWFRRDLRLADNPALLAALDEGHIPVPIYIHDEPLGSWSQGAASAWWLHHSLVALMQSLVQRGSELLIFQGYADQVIHKLLQKHDITAVYWNRCYEPEAIDRDSAIKDSLQKEGVECRSFNASLLTEPWNHLKKDGTPYRVFTPFWKTLSSGIDLTFPPGPPDQLRAFSRSLQKESLAIEDLDLLPGIPWDEGFRNSWRPGEEGARQQLECFVEEFLIDYPEGRDIPGTPGTSRLSPHLHFGEISPQQLWGMVTEVMHENNTGGVIKGGEAFLRELGWREFSYHLLYHFPHIPDQPLDERFAAFPWRKDFQEDLASWQRGQTGIPIVDAGMRELWVTGWMHNRVRMIVASLLTKNLLIPWHEGARWFWDTLVDADLANNTQGWQWTAGCGADAAPYFRIFNPVLQGERFDPEGSYVRQWVPELKDVPSKWIHRPWEAPPEMLADASVALGDNYPNPIIDLAASRRRALDCWDRLRQRGKQHSS
jgi:deoxyribodipyrimidine photo-lyase